MASVVSKSCRPQSYLAFEADHRLIPLIARTLQLNDVNGVRVERAVLTNDARRLTDGVVPFALSADFWLSREAPSSEYHVPTRSFNEIIEATKPTVLLVDIEGGEHSLFDNAINLSSVRAVRVELHPKLTGDHGTTTLFKTMIRNGFAYCCEYSRHRCVTFVS